mgnify:CR=1 FL=1
MRSRLHALLAAIALASAPQLFAAEAKPVERSYTSAPPAPSFQTKDQADAKSHGCLTCHTDSDAKTMHVSSAVVLGCTDCHGGDAGVVSPPGYEGKHGGRAPIGPVNPLHSTFGHDDHTHAGEKAAEHYAPPYLAAMEQAHVLPRYPQRWLWPSRQHRQPSSPAWGQL